MIIVQFLLEGGIGFHGAYNGKHSKVQYMYTYSLKKISSDHL